MTASLVFTIRSASYSNIRQLDRHETLREPDGASAIDPDRRHLNRILVGPATQGEALEDLFASGVKRPAKQSEAPFLQMVISASPEYFRPDDPDAKGTWDEERLKKFEMQTMSWLRKEFGDDLLHVSFHGDEDTPHYHVLVAPTYNKKPRRPGRRKRNETEEEFEARKQAAADVSGVRTVGRSSHSTLSKKGSYEKLRRSLASRVSLLGIHYGTERAADAPVRKTTAQWVKEEGNRLADERRQLADERGSILAQAREEGLDEGRAVAAVELHELREEVEELRKENRSLKRLIADLALRARAYISHRLELAPKKGPERFLLQGVEIALEQIPEDEPSAPEKTLEETDGLSLG